jgi:DNA polymerase III subunit beta
MKTSAKKLLEVLKTASHLTGGRMTLPVLSCVRISSDGKNLKVESSNLDQQQSEIVECDGELEACCVYLSNLVCAIGGESCDIKLEKQVLHVVCDFGETSLPTLDAGDFPEPMKMEKPAKQGIACADLGKAVKAASWASSRDAGRYILNSVYVSSDAKSLTVVATNGREMAYTEMKLICSKFEVVIPSSCVGNLCRWLDRDKAVISVDEKKICVETPDGSFICKQMDGKFPNWKQVIPSKKVLMGHVKAEQFSAVLIRCIPFFAAGVEVAGRFEFTKKKMSINCKNREGATLAYEIEGSFSEFTIALNIRSLLLMIQNLTTEDAKLYRSDDELSPFQVESGEFNYISMPMRLS